MRTLNTPSRFISMALVISFAAIATALVLEHIGGYLPCELCYKGRISHYVGIPVLLLTLSWAASPYRKMGSMLVLSPFTYSYSLVISIYHAGAEWKFWEGPSSCGSINLRAGVDAENLLAMLQNTKVVSCTDPAFRILGLSLAGMNALVCAAIMGLLIAALIKCRSSKPSDFDCA